MVAVPTLLLNEKPVRQLALDLEIRFLANRDPNLYFALLTDSPDSDEPHDERDALVDVCSELIEDLNRRYGSAGQNTVLSCSTGIAHINPSEGRWMGWERKRGKLLDLNQFMRGGFDSFPGQGRRSEQCCRAFATSSRSIPTRSFPATRRTSSSARSRIRCIAPSSILETNMVVAGYGILQPRIGISIQSASSSRLASIYSGQTGFDIYTRAVSDVYQDLFGEGIFTGKGIYDIDALRAALDASLP